MRYQSPRVAVLLGMGLVLAACAGATMPTATPRPAATLTPTPAPTLAPTPSPTLALAADLCDAIGDNGAIEAAAGDYRTDATQPALSLTLAAVMTGACAGGTFTLFGEDGIIDQQLGPPGWHDLPRKPESILQPRRTGWVRHHWRSGRPTAGRPIPGPRI